MTAPGRGYTFVVDIGLLKKNFIFPKLSFGKPIEDSEPLLSREEFESNMIVKQL